MKRFPLSILIAFFILESTTLFAAEGISTNQSPVVKIAEGQYQLADIEINQSERSITFESFVNMDEGVLEYALVHETGKLHESLLRTETDPKNIQLALLLISPKNPYETNAETPSVSLKFDVFIRMNPESEPVRIEDWITNAERKQSMTHGSWNFIGSYIRDGNFAAQNEGSIISVIADAASIIENPREGRDNDDIWQVNKGMVPPKDTVVEITVKFVDAKP